MMTGTWIFGGSDVGIQDVMAKICGVVLVGAYAASSAEPPAGPKFQELGHIVDYFQFAGTGRIAVADLDQDGASDLVFDAVATNSMLYVVGKNGSGSLGFKQAVITPDTDGDWPNYGYARVLAWQQDSGTRIVTVGQNGVARIYADWPLIEQGHFSIVEGAVSAALGDTNGDGRDELLVLTPSGLHAYLLDDGSEGWNYAISDGNDIALAQLDEDGALEIIIAGPVPGIVLDGATRATDWSYIDGFGYRLATGVFATGGATQWVGAQAWYSLATFRSNPCSPMWDYSTDHDIGAIATGDLDGGGVDSIVYGDGQWGDVHIIDPATHQERFSVANDGYSVRAIEIADLNGDHTPVIGFLSDSSGLDGSMLTAANGRTGEAIWRFESVAMPYRVTAIGDVDGDGMDEIVAASSGSTFEGSVSIFDFATGNREWQSPTDNYNADDPFAIAVRRIRLLPRTDGGMNIVLAGQGAYYGKIVVLDGVDKQVIRQIGDYQSPLLPFRTISGVATIDFDGDDVEDFVVATEPESTGASGAKLQVISGTSDVLLWESVAMGSGFSPINDVLVIPPQSADAASLLVAVLPDSLRAYDSQTLLLDWVLAATNQDAAYLPDGLSGPEIMTYQSNGAVTFYDAGTQAYLRAFALDAPLSAIAVLQDDPRTLLAATDQHLQLVDGSNGGVLASTGALGELWTTSPVAKPAATSIGNSSWYVALPTAPALWRLRLDVRDQIFLANFDSP
jgi:outer membrane protein assembly factor BamB